MQLTNNHPLQNGKYRIIEKIGQGGFGITYRALWTMTAQGAMGAIDTEIPIVVKEFFWKEYCYREEGTSIISISSATGKEMFSRFKEKLKKEAKILSRLSHPNIVRVLDVFEENNTAYMVMQLVEGESLKDKIAHKGKLDEATALKYTQQLCHALSEVHDKRILHLDVKPGNVIIDKNDNAQLIDFGISKQYNENQKETSTTPIGISKGYAPIEQYSGIETFNPPTDVYALGATLYSMLTGKTPIEATQAVSEDQEPIEKYNPHVSEKTIRAVNKAMEIKPTKRFNTMNEFLNNLTGERVSPQKQDESETAEGAKAESTKAEGGKQQTEGISPAGGGLRGWNKNEQNKETRIEPPKINDIKQEEVDFATDWEIVDPNPKFKNILLIILVGVAIVIILFFFKFFLSKNETYEPSKVEECTPPILKPEQFADWANWYNLELEAQRAIICDMKNFFDDCRSANQVFYSDEPQEVCPEKAAKFAEFKAKWDAFDTFSLEEQKALIDECFELVCREIETK